MNKRFFFLLAMILLCGSVLRAQSVDVFQKKTIKANMLKVAYLPAVKKGWTGLNSLVTPDGKVGWTQPIEADPRKNFDAESWEVYGAGAYLPAGSEVFKLKS